MRHGDLWFKRIEKLPGGLKPKDTNIVAEGEVTGHAHTLASGEFNLYEDSSGTLYLSVKTPSEITHQEHGAKEIAEGIYVVEKEREFDPFSEEIRRVAD